MVSLFNSSSKICDNKAVNATRMEAELDNPDF